MDVSARIRRSIETFETFYEEQDTFRVVPVITPYTFPEAFNQIDMEMKPLDAWRFPDDAEAFADSQIEAVRRFVDLTNPIGDWYVPALFPYLGIGLNTAFISGTEMRINGNVSWSPPAVNNWDDLDKLSLDEGSKWMETAIRIIKRYASRCDGSYLPATFSHYAASDMASALRGDQLFMDFYDSPDQVKALLDFCVEAATWMEEVLRATVKDTIPDEFRPGTAEGGMWIPGTATFLSEDAADLCSKDIYSEFLAPATEKTVRKFGGAFVHHHATGFHVHERMAEIPGLQVLQIAQDPDRDSPLDHIEELVGWNGSLPLAIECEASEVIDKGLSIQRGRIVLQLRISSVQEGIEAVRAIHQIGAD